MPLSCGMLNVTAVLSAWIVAPIHCKVLPPSALAQAKGTPKALSQARAVASSSRIAAGEPARELIGSST